MKLHSAIVHLEYVRVPVNITQSFEDGAAAAADAAPDFRTYADVARALGCTLDPHYGLHVSKTGKYLVHAEWRGTSHCIAVESDGKVPLIFLFNSSFTPVRHVTQAFLFTRSGHIMCVVEQSLSECLSAAPQRIAATNRYRMLPRMCRDISCSPSGAQDL